MEKYRLVGKIDINDIKPIIVEKQREKEKLVEKEDLAELEKKKIKRTKLVKRYLKITNRDYILGKITDVNTINDNTIMLKHGNYHRDLIMILESKLIELDIHHNEATQQDVSIMEMIRNIIPEGYRLYAYHGKLEGGKETFDIVLKRGSYWFNDPCCFYLFCQSLSWFNCCCQNCLQESTGDCFTDCFYPCCRVNIKGCC